MIGLLFYPWWSYWIRRSQSDKTLFELGITPSFGVQSVTDSLTVEFNWVLIGCQREEEFWRRVFNFKLIATWLVILLQMLQSPKVFFAHGLRPSHSSLPPQLRDNNLHRKFPKVLGKWGDVLLRWSRCCLCLVRELHGLRIRLYILGFHHTTVNRWIYW